VKIWEHREDLPCPELDVFSTDFFDTLSGMLTQVNQLPHHSQKTENQNRRQTGMKIRAPARSALPRRMPGAVRRGGGNHCRRSTARSSTWLMMMMDASSENWQKHLQKSRERLRSAQNGRRNAGVGTQNHAGFNTVAGDQKADH
jgi:hypothetical protein